MLFDKSDSGEYATKFSKPTASGDGITLMWVIDRQCLAVGAFSTSTCETVANTTADVGGAGNGIPVAGSRRPVYRISVRITGPHDVEGFDQATYAD